MNPYVFTYLMFFLQGLLESYFLCHYLKSENKNKSFILSQFILCTLQHPIQMWLFNVQGIKMVFYILVLYIVVFVCFPKNNLKVKLLSVVVLMLIIMFVEVIAISIIAITVGLNQMVTVTTPHPFYVYLMQLIIMFVVIKIVLNFIDKQIILSKKDYLIFILLSILQVGFLFIFNINMSIKAVGVNPKYSWIFYLALLFIAISTYIGVMFYLIQHHNKKKDEMMLLLLQKEYEEQLKYYMQQKNSHTDISIIRHDLMNYVQSQITEE